MTPDRRTGDSGHNSRPRQGNPWEIGGRMTESEFANGRSLVTVPVARLLVHPPSPATGSFHVRTR
ncbi:hypothetical protein SGPA1_50169 [Streptomyces misionensis JCM 4497]